MIPLYKVKHVYPHEDIPVEYDCWGNVTKYAKAWEIDPGDQKSFGFFIYSYGAQTLLRNGEIF